MAGVSPHGGCVELLAVDRAAARCRQEAEARGVSEGDARAGLRREGQQFLEAAREVELHAAGRQELLVALDERGISGREYVEAVRDAAAPLLVLPVA